MSARTPTPTFRFEPIKEFRLEEDGHVSPFSQHFLTSRRHLWTATPHESLKLYPFSILNSIQEEEDSLCSEKTLRQTQLQSAILVSEQKGSWSSFELDSHYGYYVLPHSIQMYDADTGSLLTKIAIPKQHLSGYITASDGSIFLTSINPHRNDPLGTLDSYGDSGELLERDGRWKSCKLPVALRYQPLCSQSMPTMWKDKLWISSRNRTEGMKERKKSMQLTASTFDGELLTTYSVSYFFSQPRFASDWMVVSEYGECLLDLRKVEQGVHVLKNRPVECVSFDLTPDGVASWWTEAGSNQLKTGTFLKC